MHSRRSSFFRKFTNVGFENPIGSSSKPNVVRRILMEDQSENDSDSGDNYVVKLRHPVREEYEMLEAKNTKSGTLEDVVKSNDPDMHLLSLPVLSHFVEEQGPDLGLPIHPIQASTYMGEYIQEDTSLNQVKDQSQNLAQEGAYSVQNMHFIEESITDDYIYSATSIQQSQIDQHIHEKASLNQNINSTHISTTEINQAGTCKHQLQTEDHNNIETSLGEDLHPTQTSISKITDNDKAETYIHQFQTEGYSREENIHSTQALTSDISDYTEAAKFIHQSQTEDQNQGEISTRQDIHPTQVSITQASIQSETSIYQVLNPIQTKDNTQEETSLNDDIHFKQTLISHTSDCLQEDTFLSQTIHLPLASISQIEDYVQEENLIDQDSYGVYSSVSLSQKDDIQSNIISLESKSSSELSWKQPYKKRKLYERLKEIELGIQEIRDESALTENITQTTIVVDIEPEQNTHQSDKKVENCSRNQENFKRNSVYKHIDFLSDSEEFIYSSSSWQGSTESIETDGVLHSSENVVKNIKQKKFSKKQNKSVKERRDFEDVKENSEPKKNKRRINKNKQRSFLKNSGKQYTSISGKVIAEKKIKSNPCTPENCHNECYSITSEKRQAIFDHYWSLNNERRRDWLVSNSKKQVIKRKRNIGDQSRRQCTFNYFINEGEGKRKVCLKFLLNTLDIKQKYMYNIITQADHGSSKDDSRGRHIPANKTSTKNIEETKSYINSLPYLPSHYCRKNTKRFYLPQEFKSLSNLYKIYKDKMKHENKEAVGEKVFQKIFREYNIAFHIPRKDKCAKCIRFEKENEGEEKEAHLKDKKETYERFQTHQKIQDINILCVSFDLQKVLNTPYGQNMLLYYSRKLAVYNLTFYESRTREGYCYSWNETEGKRGANEICTILEKYIKMVDDRGSVKHILFYSDACPGQNKNRAVLACIHACLQTCKNISNIQINYLLPGHTYMPVDSMHSVIERSVTNTIIWAPSQWATVFTLARKNPKPYHVQVLTHKDFCGWDALADKYYKGNLTGKISKVRIATFYKKSEPRTITVKYTMATDGAVEKIEVTNKNKNLQLKKIYKARLPISKKKYQDLWKLCTSKIIPEMYHHEYENFPNVVNIQDTLQDTDIEDNN